MEARDIMDSAMLPEWTKVFDAGVEWCNGNRVDDMTMVIFDTANCTEIARRVHGKAAAGPVVFAETAAGKARCVAHGRKLWVESIPFILCCLWPCTKLCGLDLPVIGAKAFTKDAKPYVLSASGSGKPWQDVECVTQALERSGFTVHYELAPPRLPS